MPLCIGVPWLYHGSSGGLLETEELSSPKIKICFICIYKVAVK